MNLQTAAQALNAFLDADIPVMMWGPPGVGKSSIGRDIVAERNWGLVDFRASTRDPVALMGLPDLTADTTKWKVPDEFPQPDRDGAEGILFLDEINAAAPSMQAAMFGLVLDRRVGDYQLPPGWRVVAAGNRQSDRAAAQRMPSALANRFAHIDVDPDVDTTVHHFNKIGVDPIVVAFLRWRPALLLDMKNDQLRAFPTPRAWEQVGKVVQQPSPLRLALIAGVVGDGAAAELEGFIRVYQGLPSLDLVLSNPSGAKVPEDSSARFAISSGLARKVTDKTIGNAMIYMQRLPREFEILFMTDAVRRDSKLSHTQAFVDWTVRNQDVVFG
ncbi:conserved hypothetical protein [uncultured Pleomorphomonas sp.]|uniref:ATPase dynein-related AAA domain-containing protein n=1 Tax=uncultured Pleomorphomonas sp. TaxID=442121 RepID=A0A212LR16_9HYPH|nr:MoxR family ATPase [uncultured Pleomorphomonas sp.]SCM79890.1 conserved hypothetical protein [uncultured Pleomorphomonas sp.]